MAEEARKAQIGEKKAMIEEKKVIIESGEAYIDSLFGLMRRVDLTTEEGQAQAYHFLDMIGQVQQLSKPLQVEEKPAKSDAVLQLKKALATAKRDEQEEK